MSKKETSKSAADAKNTIASAAPAAARPKKSKPVVYIGPNLVEPFLGTMTILTGISGHLQAAIEKQPELAQLLVPVLELGKAKQLVTTPGHPLHTAYQTVAESRRG